FAKEKLEYNNPDIITESKNDNETTYFNNKEKQNNSVNINNKVICRAYVYFCTNFGDSASKVVDLPPTFQSLETLQFICINKLQTHLMSLGLKNGLIDTIVEGENKSFKEIVQNGDL
ncbi:6144_t:CDS:2, partial [Funneliformis geosporum]